MEEVHSSSWQKPPSEKFTRCLDDQFLSRTLSVSCDKLLVPVTTRATSLLVLHRFLNRKSKEDIAHYDARILIAAILFLTCKLTESSRSFRDVFCVANKVIDIHVSAANLDSEYCKHKEDIIQLEQNVLRTLNFDLEFELPHKFMLNIARHLQLPPSVVHRAWEVLDDAMLLRESATTAPSVMACACLILAGALKVKRSDDDNHGPRIDTSNKSSSRSNGNNHANNLARSPSDDDDNRNLNQDVGWWDRYFGLSDSAILAAMQWITAGGGTQQSRDKQSAAGNSGDSAHAGIQQIAGDRSLNKLVSDNVS